MTAQIAAYGRLGADPVERRSQSGKMWATASLAVQLGDDDSATWLGIVAFGKAAETLCRHGKGDLISVAGRLQVSRWTGKDGNAREQLQLVADTVISARTVRPSGGKKHPKDTEPARPFDDPVPSDWGRP